MIFESGYFSNNAGIDKRCPGAFKIHLSASLFCEPVDTLRRFRDNDMRVANRNA